MTDLLRILPAFNVQPFASIISVVEQHGFSTTDLLAAHLADIAKQTRLPLLDLKRFVAAVQATLTDDLNENRRVLALDVDSETEDRPTSAKISTLDDVLDAALGGGVPVGRITEFAGESGVGKTQFLLTLSLAVQLAPPRGLNKQALYISTEAGLATTRLAQMLASNPLLQSMQGAQRPSLDNILSTVTPDLESQDHILEFQVPVLLARHNIGLLIVDSVAANYRAEFEYQGSLGSSMAARSSQLVKLGAHLRDLARRHGLAVVVANQVADRFASSSSPTLKRHLPHRLNNMAPPESPLASRSGNAPYLSALSSTPSSSITFPLSDDGPPIPPVLTLDHQQRWFTGWGDEPHSSHSLKTPSLGLVWTNQIACRIALTKRPVYGQARRVAAPIVEHVDDGNEDLGPTLKAWRRWMKVVFAPHVASSASGTRDAPEFEVTASGLRAVEPSANARRKQIR